MYKDIIMEIDCGRTDFIYDIKKDIKECYKKAIKSSIHLEKAKAKVNDAQIKEWENELQAVEDDKIWELFKSILRSVKIVTLVFYH